MQRELARLTTRITFGLRRRLYPSPVPARHAEYSMLYSEDDARGRPTERLLDVGLAAVAAARTIALDDIAARLQHRFRFPDNAVNLWPGEHYRLLAGFTQVLKPRLIVEIGTAEGMSALTMRKYLPPQGRIVTFDIIPWHQYPRTCLQPDDFESNRLEQIVADLGDWPTFERHRDLLSQADLIFVDAAKDGELEARFVKHFQTLQFQPGSIMVFDDIRLWNMLAVWRDLPWPKLDLTSFGHWCGTGICDPTARA